jgi:hypothetical protein
MRLCDDLDRRDGLGLRRRQPALDGVEDERQVLVERPQARRVVLDRLTGTRKERPDVRCRRLDVRLAHP